MNRLLRPQLFSTINNLSKNARKFHNTPRNLTIVYTKNEEWIDKINKSYEMGITKSALQQLGELVYIEYQMDINTKIKKDEEMVIFESVKATESILAPFDCKIIENNLELVENLDYLNENSECEDNSWILKLEKL